jgi:hypothetical protein
MVRACCWSWSGQHDDGQGGDNYDDNDEHDEVFMNIIIDHHRIKFLSVIARSLIDTSSTIIAKYHKNLEWWTMFSSQLECPFLIAYCVLSRTPLSKHVAREPSRFKCIRCLPCELVFWTTDRMRDWSCCQFGFLQRRFIAPRFFSLVVKNTVCRCANIETLAARWDAFFFEITWHVNHLSLTFCQPVFFVYLKVDLAMFPIRCFPWRCIRVACFILHCCHALNRSIYSILLRPIAWTSCLIEFIATIFES